MRNFVRATIICETLLSWLALLFALAAFFFAYSEIPRSHGPGQMGYVMAPLLGLAALFLHLSAGHLERTKKIWLSLHLARFECV